MPSFDFDQDEIDLLTSGLVARETLMNRSPQLRANASELVKANHAKTLMAIATLKQKLTKNLPTKDINA
jgi:hypothetical protein